MNKRVIKSVISKKFNEWVDSIDDKEVRDLVKANTYITGGCIPSLLLGEEVNDYDVYFKDEETTLAVARYYVDKFNNNHKGRSKIATVTSEPNRVRVYISSDGVASEEDGDPKEDEVIEEVAEKEPYRPVYLSENAITLSDDMQLIIRFFGDIDDIHSNFDFIHATSYWESGVGSLTLRQQALESILTKELWYGGSKYPLASIIRTRKFIQRGWTIHAGTYLVMVMQLNELDLKNVEVLKDQLTGVDSAYFEGIINGLDGKDITVSYISEVVEKLYR